MAAGTNKLPIIDVLVQIAESIGEGHRKLVSSSESPVGTLVVREADVSLDFAMASIQGSKTGGLLVIPSPIFAFGASVTRTARAESNKGRIVLKIVNVAGELPSPDTGPSVPKPPAIAKPSPRDVFNDRIGKLIDLLGKQPTAVVPAEGIAFIRTALGNLKDILDDFKPKDEARKRLRADVLSAVRAINKKLDSGKDADAVKAFHAMVQKYAAFLQALPAKAG